MSCSLHPKTILLLFASCILFFSHSCAFAQTTPPEPPLLVKQFTTNFILTSPKLQDSEQQHQQQQTSLLVEPGQNRIGILYFDFSKGFAMHIFKQTAVEYSGLYDENHMMPAQGANSIQLSFIGLRNIVSVCNL